MTDPSRPAALPQWSDAALDRLLHDAPDPAPADFADRVLQRLGPAPDRTPPVPARADRWRPLAERIAVVAAAALGIGQVLAFIFGLWTATAAAA